MTEMQPQVFQASNDLESVLVAINDTLPLQEIEKILDRTNLSADAKSIVLHVAHYTIVVGGRIVSIGRKLVSFAIELAKTVPNTLLGVALALILASLVASPIAAVPLIGGAIAGFLKTILIIFGLTQGVLADMRSGEIGKRIENLTSQFSPLESLTQ
jgi:hypothetical protein